MATLGQKLRELRHQKGYKLNEVAEGADLSISFISLIERDKASISVENLQKLAIFYNVRLFQIFQDIEEENEFIIRSQQVAKLGDYVNPSIPTPVFALPQRTILPSHHSLHSFLPVQNERKSNCRKVKLSSSSRKGCWKSSFPTRSRSSFNPATLHI